MVFIGKSITGSKRASSLAWLEHPADNRKVASSNLAWPIILIELNNKIDHYEKKR